MTTKIEWTDETWNPVTGCTRVSSGCKHCYAERVFPRVYPGRKFTDVKCHPERLDQPLRWRKPRRVFVNSMGDLFHEDVPLSFIVQVFVTMALARQHTFQILTKRSERMLAVVTLPGIQKWIAENALVMGHSPCAAGAIESAGWPLPNVWLGVSVEDQATADKRIPLLLETPAAVRFVSAEPILGPIDFSLDGLWHEACPRCEDEGFTEEDTGAFISPCCDNSGKSEDDVAIDWVIVGGESGPGARPIHPEWVRSLRAQCNAAQVPFFFKQWGAWAPCGLIERDKSFAGGFAFDDPSGGRTSATYLPALGVVGRHYALLDGGQPMVRVSKKRAGRELDGRTWEEYPG